MAARTTERIVPTAAPAGHTGRLSGGILAQAQNVVHRWGRSDGPDRKTYHAVREESYARRRSRR